MTVRVLDGPLDGFLLGPPGVGEAAAPTVAALRARDTVTGLHREFLDAGAEVIRTLTGALGRWRCNMAGLADDFAGANRAACEAAVAARDMAAPAALVAGTLGPVRERYEPDLLPPPALIEQEAIEQVLLLAPHVDLFVCETMSLGAEAAAMARAAASTGKPVWVAFTFHETGPLATRGGETPAQALGALGDAPVAAVLANCTAAETVGAVIDALVPLAGEGIAVGGYAHGFDKVPAEIEGEPDVAIAGRLGLMPTGYARFAREWIARGATIIGGCCGVGPAHVAALKRVAGEGA
ncbi:MAG: homocysteine S-methyltransferase family protein [Acuticoccus sp.]